MRASSRKAGRAGLALLCALFAGLSASSEAKAQGWATRPDAPIAGTLIEGTFAGLRVECTGAGRVRIVVSHSGRRFDPGRAHTVVLSIDGAATILEMRAASSGRDGDDDLAHETDMRGAAPLLDALGAGRAVEISGPAGRYTLGLSGSSRALATVRTACGN